MPSRSHVPALLLALSSIACGDDYVPAAPSSPEAYAVELAQSWCAFGLRCESASDTERYSAYCHPLAAEDRLAFLLERQPHMAYDQDAATRCLQAIDAAIGSCTMPVCEPALIGTLPEAAACDGTDQCAPGLACVGGAMGNRCSGVCAPRASEGEDCRRDECADGLHCARGRCQVDGGVGDRCGRRDECARGLDCDRGTGECFALDDAEGRACDPRGPDTCPTPTDCVDGVCTRHPLGEVAGPGEPCGPCAAEHFCDDGICRPNPGLTEECDDDDDERHCMEGRCVDDTCQLLPARAPCREDRECATDRCMGVCDVPAAVGASCDTDRDCANGLQCDSNRCVVRGPCG
ncbi:MAG: hypothetical protein JJ863_07200 [Deltaproteobacteria bacterium]|nr:hypothetical protein [Deltaproteobacteria bacterium]